MRALRLLFFSFLILLAMLLAAAGSLWLFRDALAVFAFQRWAQSQHLDAEVKSLHLGARHLEVRGLRLADARLEKAELHFTLRQLLRGELEDLYIQGLSLPIDLSGEAPPLGQLQKLFGDEDKASGPRRPLIPPDPPALPAIALEGAQVIVKTRWGLFPLTLEGRVTPGAARHLDLLQLDYRGEGPGGLTIAGDLQSDLDHLRPQNLKAQAALDWQDRGKGSITLGSEALQAGGDLEVTARLAGAVQNLSSFLVSHDRKAPSEASSGQLDAALEGVLHLPPLPYLDREPPRNWLVWLSEQEITAQLQLAGQEIAVPRYASGLVFYAALSAQRRAGGTDFFLDAPLEIDAASLGPAMTDALPELAAAYLAEGISLQLQSVGEGTLLTLDRQAAPKAALQARLDLADQATAEMLLEATFPPSGLASAEASIRELHLVAPATPLAESVRISGTGSIKGRKGRASGQLDLSLSARQLGYADTTADSLELQAPLELEFLDEKLNLNLEKPGRLAAVGLTPPGSERIEELAVTLEAFALELDLKDDLRGSLSALASTESASAELGGLGPAELRGLLLKAEAEITAGSLSQGAARIQGDRIFLPELEIALTDFLVEAPLAGDEPLLRLQQARLRSEAAAALFPPLNLKGELDRNFHFHADARGLQDRIILTAEGFHDLDKDEGRAAIRLGPLRFLPEGLQPSIFGIQGQDIRDARGEFRADSDLTWSSRRFNGRLRLRAQDLDFTYDGTLLKGVSFDFRIADLQTLRTEAPQRVEISRIDAGISPVTDLDIWLSLEPRLKGPPALRLDQADADFAEGHIQITSGQADLHTQHYSGRILLTALDLAALLRLIGLEELTASGHISGNIPLDLIGDTLSIDKGLLQNEGPGVIAFRSAAAREALAAGGEYVELMFDALENFHYDKLEIALTKPPRGETLLHLRLLGANPDVLDAQPFDLNINVTTNLSPLLEVLAETRRIQHGVTERLWKLVQ